MKRTWRILGSLAAIVVAALFVWYVVRSLRGQDLSAYATPHAAIGIVLAALLWSCGAPLMALAWRGMLAGLGVRKHWRELFAIISITQFAKYIPGNVAQYIGRVGMSLARGVPARPLAVTLILETLLVVAAAVVMGVGTGALSDVGLQALRLHAAQLALIVALIVLALLGLLIFRQVAPKLLRRFAPRYAPTLDGTLLPAQAPLGRAFVLYCAMYITMGAGLILLAHFLLPGAPRDYWLLIAVFALAWVVGFVTPGAPGGLGVREALMVLMLAPVYTAASASVLVIALRIATTLGDMLLLAAGWLALPKKTGAAILRSRFQTLDADSRTPPDASPRVILIGPVTPPFRGGIARYTTELHAALARFSMVRTISFHRLYPRWLYPGASDREPGMEQDRLRRVAYILDPLNPFTWFAAIHATRDGNYNLVVINWWTLFCAPGFAYISHRLRAAGIPVILICHNLADHDSGGLKRYLSNTFLTQADAYLAHSSEQARILSSRFPGKPVCMHPHPVDGHYPPAAVTLPKRGRLELLFFGFIRPYKGLDVLIDALALLSDDDVYLTVVGESWSSSDEIEKCVARSLAPNVELHLQYVDAVGAANFFSRADLIVLPYRSATGSAVAAVAYHYGKPLLATRVGGLPDVVEEGRTGFLVDPESPQQLADCLRDIDRGLLQQMSSNVQVFKSRFTWPSMATTLLDLACRVHEVRGGHRSGAPSGGAIP